MKKLLIVLFIISVAPVFAQVAGERFTNAEFGWSIDIPKDFESVSPKDWEKIQSNGADMMGEAIDEDLSEAVEVNKTIFVIKNGLSNYLEVCQQPFDPAVDGDYTESNALIIDALKETFKQQLPQATTTSNVFKEVIGGKEFAKNEVIVTMPNGFVFYCYMYSRLFGKKNFCVNIMYIDKAQGKLMMDALKNSIFK